MQETKSSDWNESDNFVDGITDEALERAACADPANARAFTVAYCTGQMECPF